MNTALYKFITNWSHWELGWVRRLGRWTSALGWRWGKQVYSTALAGIYTPDLPVSPKWVIIRSQVNECTHAHTHTHTHRRYIWAHAAYYTKPTTQVVVATIYIKIQKRQFLCSETWYFVSVYLCFMGTIYPNCEKEGFFCGWLDKWSTNMPEQSPLWRAIC